MPQKNEALEIIIPVYNEEQCLDELFKRLMALREKLLPIETSFIFINDGSTDSSLKMLYSYAEKHDIVKVIDLSRNFGHQLAITAGLDHAGADYVAVIDADLQDPPELIEDMYKKAEEGFDIVYAQRLIRKQESFFKKITAKLFYLLIKKMCDTEIPPDTGDYRLIRKNVLTVLKQMREKHRFIRGMVPWTGFKSTPLYYNREKRYAGKTKFPPGKMVLFAMDAIFSFSNIPIRVATVSGLIISGLGFMGFLLIVYLRFFTHQYVLGISAVIVAVTILGGFQIIMLGVIGEYIGRIFEESKKRPLYIIRDTKNLKSDEVA